VIDELGGEDLADAGASWRDGSEGIFPPGISRIAHLTPHAWAIEALNASIATSATPAEVAPDLTVLALYAAGLLAVATVVLRRTITQRAM
jgi:ABC-2 type transport system permease protein